MLDTIKNSHQGTGLLIKKLLKPIFRKINNRMCSVSIKLKHCKLLIILAYAPTLQNSEKIQSLEMSSMSNWTPL